MMQAVEFETVIHDRLITVPEKFRQFDHKRIRVLLLDTEEPQPIANLPEGFSHPLKVASYNLAAREDIYDR